MHRVRVGLIGLLSVFLLVMVAAAVLRVTSDIPRPDSNSGAALNDTMPTEPLAQLGVAPGNTPPEENSVGAVKSGTPPIRR